MPTVPSSAAGRAPDDRRAPGHHPLLVPARRLLARGAVRGRRPPGHPGARRHRPQLARRAGAGACGRAHHRLPARRRLPARSRGRLEPARLPDRPGGLWPALPAPHPRALARARAPRRLPPDNRRRGGVEPGPARGAAGRPRRRDPDGAPAPAEGDLRKRPVLRPVAPLRRQRPPAARRDRRPRPGGAGADRRPRRRALPRPGAADDAGRGHLHPPEDHDRGGGLCPRAPCRAPPARARRDRAPVRPPPGGAGPGRGHRRSLPLLPRRADLHLPGRGRRGRPAGPGAAGRDDLEGAAKRFPAGVPEAVRKQLADELDLVASRLTRRTSSPSRRSSATPAPRASCARAAARRRIRRSATACGITAIDPVDQGLLFARFINETRDEPPTSTSISSTSAGRR